MIPHSCFLLLFLEDVHPRRYCESYCSPINIGWRKFGKLTGFGQCVAIFSVDCRLATGAVAVVFKMNSTSSITIESQDRCRHE